MNWPEYRCQLSRAIYIVEPVRRGNEGSNDYRIFNLRSDYDFKEVK